MRFEEHVRAHKEAYIKENPFPHAALHGLFAEQALDDILDCFPDLDDAQWDRRNDVGIQVLYYYTSKRPEEEIRFGEQHRALFSSRDKLLI